MPIPIPPIYDIDYDDDDEGRDDINNAGNDKVTGGNDITVAVDG